MVQTYLALFTKTVLTFNYCNTIIIICKTTSINTMKQIFYHQILCRLVLCTALAAMTACGGIPLSSLPRLMQMQNDVLGMNPAEFMVALQVDVRLVPPASAVPLLVIKLEPRQPGAFEAVDKKLPLQVSVVSVATLGLAAPPAGRRWLIYSMPPDTQAEMRRIQSLVLRAKALPNNQGSGSLGVGVAQDSLAITEPALANTRWDTWLQTKQRDGFFEAWVGTPAQIQAMAAKAK
jgi:hypothetical protein